MSTARPSTHSSHSHSSRDHKRKHDSHSSSDPKKHKAHHSSSKQEVIPSVEAGSSGTKKARSQFLLDINYDNTAPPLPFDPKLLHIHLAPDRLVRYSACTLEKELKYELMAEKLLGIPLDLIEAESLLGNVGLKPKLAYEDELILPLTAAEKRQRQGPTQFQLFAQGSSNWLRQATYQTNNLYETGNKQVALTDAQEQQRAEVEQYKKQQDNSREAQIAAIERTFEEVRTTPVHMSNKHWKPVHVWDILPDSGIDNEFTWTMFDYSPFAHVLNSIKKEQGATGAEAGENSENAPAVNPDEVDEKGNPVTDEASQASQNIPFASPSPPAPSSTILLRDALPSSILKQYDLQHHGLYVGNRTVNVTSDETEDEAAHIVGREGYEWLREYTSIPVPPIEADNNYFFVTSGSHIFYSRYNHRLRVAKRTATLSDKHADEEVETRPHALSMLVRDDIEVEQVPDYNSDEEMYEAEQEAPEEEEE